MVSMSALEYCMVICEDSTDVFRSMFQDRGICSRSHRILSSRSNGRKMIKSADSKRTYILKGLICIPPSFSTMV